MSFEPDIESVSSVNHLYIQVQKGANCDRTQLVLFWKNEIATIYLEGQAGDFDGRAE